MQKRRFSSGTRWESLIGYSRTIRVGPFIKASGTTVTDESGEIQGKDDPYVQTVHTLKNIEKALKALGADLEDVVGTHIFVTSIDDWEKVGRAHGEFFGKIRPATSIVEVKRLIFPEMLVEIEAEAIISLE